MLNDEQLFMLCKDINFDEKLAEKLIENQNLNVVTHGNTTFLYTAVESENIKMVQLLLEKGADPNFYTEYDGPVLWKLQYIGFFDMDANDQLELVKMLLDYGASPNVMWEDESLFDYIVYKVFNETDSDDWYYIVKFFVYLVVYGGNSDYCSPIVYEEFDKTCLDDYKFNLLKGCGEILKDGKKIADI